MNIQQNMFAKSRGVESKVQHRSDLLMNDQVKLFTTYFSIQAYTIKNLIELNDIEKNCGSPTVCGLNVS